MIKPRKAARALPSNTLWNKRPLGSLADRQGFTIQTLAERLGLTSLYVRFLLLGDRPLTLPVILGMSGLGFPLEELHKIAQHQRR